MPQMLALIAELIRLIRWIVIVGGALILFG